MMDEMIKLMDVWKESLYSLWEDDVCYPTSCDAITKLMLREIGNRKYFSEYEIRYIRGHYVPDLWEKGCDLLNVHFGDEDVDSLRKSTIRGAEHECFDCSCDEVMQHSYIELEKCGEIVVLDFSAYQFTEDFNSTLDVEPDKLILMRSPVVYQDDERFGHYIPTQKVVNIVAMGL